MKQQSTMLTSRKVSTANWQMIIWSLTLILLIIIHCSKSFVKICLILVNTTQAYWTKMRSKRKRKREKKTLKVIQTGQNQLSSRHVPPTLITLLSEALRHCSCVMRHKEWTPVMRSLPLLNIPRVSMGVRGAMFCISSWIPGHPTGQGES